MTTADANANANGNAAPMPDPFDELGRKRRPWWIVVLVGLVVLLGAGVLWARKHRPPPPPKYLTAHVTSGDITETIESTGTVQPVLQVQVGSQVSGRISRVLVDFNSRVHQGDLIAEIDPTPYRAQVAQQRAALLSARAGLARARADLDLQERNLVRAQDMRARNLNAQADLDAAVGARDSSRAALQVAQAQIGQADASLAQAQTNLEYTRIIAPIDGVVITRSIDPGQTVAASFQAPVLFVIANDLTQMRVLADVDEADIGRLREGLVAEARVDAFPGETFRGVVHELRFGPTTTSGVVTYPAVIDVGNPESKLRPGMTATITVTTAQRHGVLRVPNAALRFRPTPTHPTTGAGAGAGAGGHGGMGHGAGGAAGGGAAGGGAGAGASGGAGGGDGDNEASAHGGRYVLGPHMGRIFLLRDGHPVRVVVQTGASDGVNTEVSAPELHPGLDVITDETDEAIPHDGPAGAGGGRQGGRRAF